MIMIGFLDLCFALIGQIPLLGADMTSILDLFEMHDQVFVLKESEVYKLHVTKESVHKFFMS